MNEIRAKLIEQALNRHKKIFPCVPLRSLEECFTVTGKRVLFGLNTEDQSTHIVAAEYDDAAERQEGAIAQ